MALEKAVKSENFREDLYYRLNVLPITLKPLRERLEDLEPLVAFFCEKENEKNKTSKHFLAPTVAKMRKHSWPGNIRELENYVTRLMVLCPGSVIRPEDLDERFYGSEEDEIHDHDDFKKKQNKEEKDFLLKTFCQFKTIRDTARRLNLSPSTLYSRMESLGILPKKQKTEDKAV